MNWDDLKFFLVVCRTGSIRAAAKSLGVNHATVSRRINGFEQALGERLFDRSAKGYVPTAAADDIFREASNLEERLSAVERRVVGKDKTLKGDIKITLPDILAQGFLMPDLADFCRLYPQIELEIIDSTRPFNLANREADVAFRLCDEPPEYLVGRKLASVHRSCYIARSSIPKLQDPEWLSQQNWLGWSDKLRRPIGKIAREYPRFSSKHKIMSASIQTEACKQGLGIAILPCFYGETVEGIVRLPPYTSAHRMDLWILSHPDLRKNAKIQTFVRFMTDKILEKRAMIEGEVFNRLDQD